ncbi:MAG: hypothetical protein WBD55_02035 [Dehalococcoidia bacterium]
MGREQLETLSQIIQQQLALGTAGVIAGSWSIRFNKDYKAFEFDKCEFEGYCEERPSMIALDGTVLDPGGPLLSEPSGA